MKGIEKYISFLNTLGGIFIVVLMLLISADVFMRAAFHSPILGTIELVQILACLIVYFGFAYNALKDEHVKVDVIKRWPVMDLVTDVISVIIITIFIYAAFIQAQGAQAMHQQTQMLHIPLAPVKYFIVFGFINLDIGIVCMRINKIREQRASRKDLEIPKETVEVL
jgi:TRAP-type C4-dicarboxylate transport system permease small subunit